MVIDILSLESFLVNNFKSFNVFVVNPYLLYCIVPFSIVKKELKHILDILPSSIDFTISFNYVQSSLMITFYVPVGDSDT